MSFKPDVQRRTMELVLGDNQANVDDLAKSIKESCCARAAGRLRACVSYDEKPGIQALGTTTPDRPPRAGRRSAVGRDHEYVRHCTATLLAGLDLLTGHVHSAVVDRQTEPS